MPVVLMIIRILQGLALCYMTGVFAALAAENVPADRFEEGVGYFGAVVPTMSFFGPAVGRILVAKLGTDGVLYGLSCLMLLPIVIIAVTRMPDIKPLTVTDVRRKLNIEPAAIPASLFLMCIAGAQTSMVSFLPLYATKYDINTTLFFYIAAGLGVLIIRIATTILKKQMLKNMAVAAFAVCIGTLLLLPIFHNAFHCMVFGLIYGVAQGTLQPHFIALALEAAPTDSKSAATVTYFIFNDIGTVVLGVAWGYIAQFWGYYNVFVTAAAINMIAMVGWVIYSKKVAFRLNSVSD